MADHVFEYAETAAAYRQATHWWRSLVGAVDDERWEQPALGLWSVRELVAHTGRAFKTVVEYVEGDTKDPTAIATAAEYFRIVLSEETPHVHIAARAQQEAAARSDWVAATDELADAATQVVARHRPDTTVHLFVGEMRLDQYLATRVVELVVHGLDLAAAIEIPTAAPAGAARVAIDVLLDLAEGEDLSAVARMLTGRAVKWPETNVLN